MSCRTPFTAHFAATFTTLGFRKKNLFMIFYYVHYAMFMSKRSKILFQCYVHGAMIMKSIRFTLGFVKNHYLIATTSTTPRSWQKSMFFLFSTNTFTTPWWWEKVLFSLLLTATTFTTLRLCLVRSLRHNHDKDICFYFSTTCTTWWSCTKNKLFLF